MIGRRAFSGMVFCAIAASTLAGCGSKETVRYKMTVEIQTPEGIKSGSAVREVIGRTPPSIPMLGEDRGSISVRGEAVAVGLPDGQTLFALLTGPSGETDYAATVPLRVNGNLTDSIIELWPKAPVHVHNPQGLAQPPMLVRFRDISEPKSVEKVEPDSLEVSFGQGVKLMRITIQRTVEPVTTGIEERLKKLGIEPNHSLDNDFKMTTNPTLAQSLGYDDFAKGLNK